MLLCLDNWDIGGNGNGNGMKPVYIYKGFPVYLSNKANKKYMAMVNGRIVYFGDTNYQQYHDKIGYYRNLDHNDKRRRESYYLRHNIDYPVGTADWFSKQLLW